MSLVSLSFDLIFTTKAPPTEMSSEDHDFNLEQLLSLEQIEVPAEELSQNKGAHPPVPTPPPFRPGLPPRDSVGVLTSLGHLKTLLFNEIKNQPQTLLSLNPTRKFAIARYLSQLTPQVARLPLEYWLSQPLTAPQDLALKAYIEEIALVTLSQVLVLKAWSDRSLRPLQRKDLSHLNTSLAQSLKERTPLDREGWQITSRNIYSWFQPGPALQEEIWAILQSWRFADEGPALILGWMEGLRSIVPENAPPKGYDTRLFAGLWDYIHQHTPSSIQREMPGFKRQRMAFSPTLRDGNLILSGPMDLRWTGGEVSPFLGMLAEIGQLWWGPSEPPLWNQGLGLDVHTREQLPLALYTPKPSLVSRIAEIEACEVSFVLEERPVRLSSRDVEAAEFREQLEALPYFAKTKGPRVTLGMLQACVAVTKLRAGGLLIWARETPLNPSEGAEAVRFLFEKACLVGELAFDKLSHQLPSRRPLLPKYLYIFKRETQLEATHQNRPRRVFVSGSLRSHVELPRLIAEALRPLDPAQDTRELRDAKENWKVFAETNLPAQKDWVERWPEEVDPARVAQVEGLRVNSQPLSTIASVVRLPKRDAARPARAAKPETNGLWLSQSWQILDEGSPEPKLFCGTLNLENPEGDLSILFQDAAWNAPLLEYFKSKTLRSWIEANAEKRGRHYFIDEQLAKFIPIPHSLVRALKGEGADPRETKRLLPLEWERHVASLFSAPEHALEMFQKEKPEPSVQAALFVRTARTLHEMLSSQGKLLSMVKLDGNLSWKQILSILPPQELCSFTLHPKIEMVGHLPNHQPIDNIQYIFNSAPYRVRFTQSNGFQLTLSSDVRGLIDLVAEQLDGVTAPTWSELVTNLRVPRKWELAETAAQDILRSHGTVLGRIRVLNQILSECSFF